MASKTPLVKTGLGVITSTIGGLVLFAVLFANVLVTGQAFFQKQSVPPSWQQAQWLEYPSGSDVLYTRKEFQLDTVPDWASLTIAALDDFTVYLNGQQIAEKSMAGRYPIDIVDITSILKVGNNSIAIQSVSGQKQLNARIITRLNWSALGQNYNLVSGRSWRVENKELFQRQGSLAWYQKQYQFNNWVFAKPLGFKQELFNHQLISAEALRKLQLRNWIVVTDYQFRHLNLSRTFTIDADAIHGAWLAISVDGKFQVVINKLILDGQVGSHNKMLYFPISSYLQAGKNQIALQVFNTTKQFAKVGISGLVLADSREIDISADHKWLCRPAPCHLQLLEPDHAQVPRLKAIMVDTPNAYTWLQWIHRIYWSLLIFVCSIFLAALLIPAVMRKCQINFISACLIYAQPYTLVSIVLAGLILVDADSRFDFSSYYAVYIPVLVIIVIILLLSLPFFEAKRKKQTTMLKEKT